MKTLIINNYSSYEKDYRYSVKDSGDRIAAIFDKLIEITARHCDAYASDIYWTMRSFEEACKNDAEYVRYLDIRETGVTAYKKCDLEEELTSYPSNIISKRCVWKLSRELELNEYGEVKAVNKLRRVSLRVVDL